MIQCKVFTAEGNSIETATKQAVDKMNQWLGENEQTIKNPRIVSVAAASSSSNIWPSDKFGIAAIEYQTM